MVVHNCKNNLLTFEVLLNLCVTHNILEKYMEIL